LWQEPQGVSPVRSRLFLLLFSLFAGVLGLCVGFPLDTVKVRFQDPVTAGRYRHNGTFSTVAKIVREERFLRLYKGIMSPMVRQE